MDIHGLQRQLVSGKEQIERQLGLEALVSSTRQVSSGIKRARSIVVPTDGKRRSPRVIGMLTERTYKVRNLASMWSTPY